MSLPVLQEPDMDTLLSLKIYAMLESSHWAAFIICEMNML